MLEDRTCKDCGITYEVSMVVPGRKPKVCRDCKRSADKRKSGPRKKQPFQGRECNYCSLIYNAVFKAQRLCNNCLGETTLRYNGLSTQRVLAKLNASNLIKKKKTRKYTLIHDKKRKWLNAKTVAFMKNNGQITKIIFEMEAIPDWSALPDRRDLNEFEFIAEC